MSEYKRVIYLSNLIQNTDLICNYVSDAMIKTMINDVIPQNNFHCNLLHNL